MSICQYVAGANITICLALNSTFPPSRGLPTAPKRSYHFLGPPATTSRGMSMDDQAMSSHILIRPHRVQKTKRSIFAKKGETFLLTRRTSETSSTTQMDTVNPSMRRPTSFYRSMDDARVLLVGLETTQQRSSSVARRGLDTKMSLRWASWAESGCLAREPCPM